MRMICKSASIACWSQNAVASNRPCCSSKSAAPSKFSNAATPSPTMPPEKFCAPPTKSPSATTSPCASRAANSPQKSSAKTKKNKPVASARKPIKKPSRELVGVSVLFVDRAAGDFQHREERFLGDINAADAFHALLSFFLLFEQFAFAADVSAVALGDDVFANRADRFAGNDPAADGGLNGNFEHLARNQFTQARHQIVPALVGLVAVANHRQCVDR